jgi:hypothetical protein
MAGFSRANGDAAGVVNYDVASRPADGSTAGSAGVPIQPQGPKLDIYTGDLGASGVSSQFDTGGAVEAVLRTMQQMSTVYMYEFANDGKFRVLMYPTGGDSAAALQVAVRALGTVNGYDLSAARVDSGATLTSTIA